MNALKLVSIEVGSRIVNVQELLAAKNDTESI